MVEVIQITARDKKKLDHILYLGKEGWFIADGYVFLFDRERFRAYGTFVYKDDGEGLKKSTKAVLHGWLDKPIEKSKVRIGDLFRERFKEYRVEVKGNGRS